MSFLFIKVKNVLFGSKYLWLTNTLSCGVLLGVGDIIQQNIEMYTEPQEKKTLDTERIKQLFLFPLFPLFQIIQSIGWQLLGYFRECPITYGGYIWLDRVLPGTARATVGKKVIADQLIASPLFSASFFMGAGLLEGHSISEAWREFRQKFLMVYLVDCAVWPPIQIINFLFVPSAYRVLYSSTLTVAWNVFLSYAKHFDQKPSHNDDSQTKSHKRKEGS